MNIEVIGEVVVKNKSTAKDREFWSHVEAIAQQSRRIRAALSSTEVSDGDLGERDSQKRASSNSQACSK